MSKILHCGVWTRVQVYRIISSKPAYCYQILYHATKCKGECHAELMLWAGEYQDGQLTERFPIDAHEFADWKRRAEKELARPEPQLFSEYSQRIAQGIESQIRYQARRMRKLKMPFIKTR